VGDAMRAGRDPEAKVLSEESRRAGEELEAVENRVAKVGTELRDALLRLPNLPAEEAPDGDSAGDNVVLRTVGYDPERYGPHQRVPHWDIGRAQLWLEGFVSWPSTTTRTPTSRCGRPPSCVPLSLRQ
jgi:seryl-tRNA synthetase